MGQNVPISKQADVITVVKNLLNYIVNQNLQIKKILNNVEITSFDSKIFFKQLPTNKT